MIHLTGTNGKGSTAAMIESLLRADGLRTGRFTSPHVTSVTERITIDGESISEERFDDVWREIEPYVALVDEQQIDGVAMTFFEIITAMAYAAFADAPVDVAVIEVGLGGTWDATNVADAEVAVVTPIDLDHTHLLGRTMAEIAREKAGIIKPGAHAILAGQSLEAAQVLLERCAEVGALPQREGIDFGLIDRQLAVGGQLIRLNGAEGPVDDVFLPLHGAHQAANAGQALAAVEAFLGLKALNPDVAREGFAQVQVPRSAGGGPPLADRGAGRRAQPARGPGGGRRGDRGVRLHPADRGGRGDGRQGRARACCEVFDEVMNQVVVTQVASTSRGLPADRARASWRRRSSAPTGSRVVPRLDDAIEQPSRMADAEGVGRPGVLVTGSVVAVGEARTLLVTDDDPVRPRPPGRPRRRLGRGLRRGRRGARRRPGELAVRLSAQEPDAGRAAVGPGLRGDRLRAGDPGDDLHRRTCRPGRPPASAAARRCWPWLRPARCVGRSAIRSAGPPSWPGVALGFLISTMFVVGVMFAGHLGGDVHPRQAAGRPAAARPEPQLTPRGGQQARRPARQSTPSVRSKAVPRSPSASTTGFSTSSVTSSATRAGRDQRPGEAPVGHGCTSPKNRSSSAKPLQRTGRHVDAVEVGVDAAQPERRRVGPQPYRGSRRRRALAGSVAPISSERRTLPVGPALPCRNAQTVSSAVKKLSWRGWNPFSTITGVAVDADRAAYVPGPSRPTLALEKSMASANGLNSGYVSRNWWPPSTVALPSESRVLLLQGTLGGLGQRRRPSREIWLITP